MRDDEDARREFGQVQVEERADGSRAFIARWREDGRRPSKSFRTRDEAVAHLVAREREARRAAEDGRPVDASTTLSEFLPDAMREWAVALADKGAPRRNVLLVAAKLIGEKSMAETTHADACRWRDLRSAQGCSPGTLKTEFVYLSATWQLARSRGLCRTNPWRKDADTGRSIRLPRVPRTVAAPVSESTLATLYASASERGRLCIVLMGEMGMRRAESCAVLAQGIAPGAVSLTFVGKGNKSRTVPTTARVREELARALAGRVLMPSARVTPDVNPSAVSYEFELAAAAAGMPELHPHSLRHAAARRWHDAGMSLRDIMQLLGHARLSTTETYLGLAAPSELGAAMAKAEAARSRSTTPDALRVAQ